MKNQIALLLIFFLVACKQPSSTSTEEVDNIDTASEKQVVKPKFQALLDTAKVEGSVLLYDLETMTYYSNDFEWAAKGHLPASTFKIPNSIIGLETGVVEDDSTLFEWDGEERMLKVWEKDMVFRDAFHASCVPCYQDVARRVGADRMRTYVDKLEFGSMKFDSSTVDMFWLVGDSRISQMEQIDFLRRLYESELDISERTESIIKEMIVMQDTDRYKMSGKTGLSIRSGKDNGWFVGFIENEKTTYFFATNIEPNENTDRNELIKARKTVTFDALKLMGIM